MPADDGSPPRATIGVPRAGASAPLVLAIQSGQRQVVHAACREALAIGLSPGTAIAQAKALVPDLEVMPADPAGDIATLRRLALHAARHWTPLAAVSEPDGLWLDLTGASHLFGGEEAFRRRAAAFLRRVGLTATIAIADTAGAAHALARFGGETGTIVAPGGHVQAIAALPVCALRLDAEAAAAARRFGIERVADLLPMPRGPLARRLGRHAVMRLDQAIGRVAEPLDPVVPAEPPTAEFRLLEPIGTPEAIAQLVGDLVAALAETLRSRGFGVRALELVLLRVDSSEQRLSLGTSRATRDAAHLTRLLSLRIETIDPGMGVEAGRLTARRVEPLGATELGPALAGATGAPDLAPLVDQLAGRIGEGVFRTTLVESDVPERAVRRTAPLEAVAGWPAWRRPARLLRRPEPLSGVVALLPDHPPRRFSWRGDTYDVVAGDGPERIHGEWWVRDGEIWAVRDYYRVEDRAGRRFWVFRRGDGVDAATGDLSWWTHGAFG